MSFAILLLAAVQGAVPPPLQQASADCRATTYATDMLVCGDPELLSLNTRMNTLLGAKSVPQGNWIEPQEDWFRRSRLCAMRDAHLACATAAYRERIALLEVARLAPVEVQPCRRTDLRMARSAEGFALYQSNGALVGYGQTASSDWTPFLLARTKGRTMIFTFKGKVVARCG